MSAVRRRTPLHGLTRAGLREPPRDRDGRADSPLRRHADQRAVDARGAAGDQPGGRGIPAPPRSGRDRHRRSCSPASARARWPPRWRRAARASASPSCCARTTIVARGPKPVAALRELGLAPTLSVPEPNTWRELLGDPRRARAGRRPARRGAGIRPQQPRAARRPAQRGAEVLRVPVYRWDYPRRSGPAARRRSRSSPTVGVDIALFTSARQVDHVVETATRLGRLRRPAARRRAGRVRLDRPGLQRGHAGARSARRPRARASEDGPSGQRRGAARPRAAARPKRG